MPRPASAPAAEIASKAPLPPSLRAALPVAADLVKHFDAISRLVPRLEAELKRAKDGGAVTLARAYVVLYRVMKESEEDLKPLEAVLKTYKETEVPAMLELEGLTSVPLAEGFRVTASHVWRASIKPDMKNEAYDWLRRSGHGDIISTTVNSSTLSALAKELVEEKNLELPDKFFNAAQLPNTSVTATK